MNKFLFISSIYSVSWANDIRLSWTKVIIWSYGGDSNLNHVWIAFWTEPRWCNGNYGSTAMFKFYLHYYSMLLPCQFCHCSPRVFFHWCLSTWRMMVRYKSALRKYFTKSNQSVVFFERNYKTSHLQIQVRCMRVIVLNVASGYCVHAVIMVLLEVA